MKTINNLDCLRSDDKYPRVPGHEIAGIIDKIGADVTRWESGQRVAVGWHVGHDSTYWYLHKRGQKGISK